MADQLVHRRQLQCSRDRRDLVLGDTLAHERRRDGGIRDQARLLRDVLELEVTAPRDDALVGHERGIVAAHRALHQHLEQRRLARAVRADHADAIALVQRERCAGEDTARAVSLLETLNGE